jgi:hypothetical protein
MAGVPLYDRSGIMIETGADLKLHFELLGKFDRAGLHDLGAEAGQFQHFVVGNFVDFLAFGTRRGSAV